MFGNRRRGLEALLLQDAECGGKRGGGSRDGVRKHGGQGAGAQVDHKLVAAGGGREQIAIDRRLVAIAADARADVAAGGAVEDLQMGDGRAGGGEFGVETFEQRTDDGGGRQGGFEAQFAFPIEPAEGGFGGGVAGVVDIEETGAGGETAAEDFVEPFGYALSGKGTDAARRDASRQGLGAGG